MEEPVGSVRHRLGVSWMGFNQLQKVLFSRLPPPTRPADEDRFVCGPAGRVIVSSRTVNGRRGFRTRRVAVGPTLFVTRQQRAQV